MNQRIRYQDTGVLGYWGSDYKVPEMSDIQNQSAMKLEQNERYGIFMGRVHYTKDGVDST